MNETSSQKFNIVLLGDPDVGKTCLVTQFVRKVFSLDTEPTLGVNFDKITIKLGNHEICLLIHDTAGASARATPAAKSLRNAAGVVLVYDVSDPITFYNVKAVWMREADKYAPRDATRIIVGNKDDLRSRKVVDYHTAKRYADQMGVPFFEVSAKDGTSVEQAFMTMVVDICSRLTTTTEESSAPDFSLPSTDVVPYTSRTIKLDDEPKKEKKSKCC